MLSVLCWWLNIYSEMESFYLVLQLETWLDFQTVYHAIHGSIVAESGRLCFSPQTNTVPIYRKKKPKPNVVYPWISNRTFMTLQLLMLLSTGKVFSLRCHVPIQSFPHLSQSERVYRHSSIPIGPKLQAIYFKYGPSPPYRVHNCNIPARTHTICRPAWVIELIHQVTRPPPKGKGQTSFQIWVERLILCYYGLRIKQGE